MALLEMRNITKVYPNGVIANQDVDLLLQPGEIHALMGENGAGKSTLMKILFGIEQPTSGQIIYNGQEVRLKNPLHAIELGIGMVHQHFMLDDHLTVTENIILGMEPTKGIQLDIQKARQMVKDVAELYNFNINVDRKIMDLDVGKKQKVEILKALIRGAKLLILDEPTAVLTPQETKELFVQLKKLKEAGHTIIFISHKLNEVKEICNRATVMRSGKYIGSYELENTSIEELSRMMVGRDVVREIEKQPLQPKETVLEVNDIKVINDEHKQVVNGISFRVRQGEILGIAGVEGNGQRELIDCITGLETEYQGAISINGKAVGKKKAVASRRKEGLFHIPEDRLTYGVMAESSIADNLIANVFHKKEFNRGFLIHTSKVHQLADQLIQEYQIKTDSKHTPIRMLSGGNMQKVVAAREMSEQMTLLVADQPTRGIDVGTASFIHDRIVQLRDQGVAVLLVSADINEVMELSDSLIVCYEGRITGYFEDASSVTEEELGLYMLGLKQMPEEIIRRVAQ